MLLYFWFWNLNSYASVEKNFSCPHSVQIRLNVSKESCSPTLWIFLKVVVYGVTASILELHTSHEGLYLDIFSSILWSWSSVSLCSFIFFTTFLKVSIPLRRVIHMKEFIKVFSFILIVGTIFIILGFKHFDKPTLTCENYMEEIQGDLSSCTEAIKWILS